MQTKKYYTYAHKDGADIVYIGKGCGGRVYAREGRTTQEHRDFITLRQDSGDYTYATILESGLTEKQAFERETTLISTLNPKYNIKSKNTTKGKLRVYPHLSPQEAMALGSKKGQELAKLSPRNGKRGKGKKNLNK